MHALSVMARRRGSCPDARNSSIRAGIPQAREPASAQTAVYGSKPAVPFRQRAPGPFCWQMGNVPIYFWRRALSTVGSTGLVKWWSKPDAAARSLSAFWPQPVTAIKDHGALAALLANALRDFVTGKAGHADVENHDFGLHAGKHLDGLESVGGDVHLVTIETQQHRQRFAGIAIVVGHENAPQPGRGNLRAGRRRC